MLNAMEPVTSNTYHSLLLSLKHCCKKLLCIIALPMQDDKLQNVVCGDDACQREVHQFKTNQTRLHNEKWVTYVDINSTTFLCELCSHLCKSRNGSYPIVMPTCSKQGHYKRGRCHYCHNGQLYRYNWGTANSYQIKLNRFNVW